MATPHAHDGARMAYRCTYCHETKTGRFRRPSEVPGASGRGWSRGMQMPVWICRECDQAQGTATKGAAHGE